MAYMDEAEAGYGYSDPNQDIYADPQFRAWAAQQEGAMGFLHDMSGNNDTWSYNTPSLRQKLQAQARGTPLDYMSEEELVGRWKMQQANNPIQNRINTFNAYQKNIDPNTAFQKVGDTYTHAGLPVRQDANGNWFYDSATVAQNMGYTPQQAAQLNNINPLQESGLYTDYNQFNQGPASMGRIGAQQQERYNIPGFTNDQGIFLQNLARTPVYLNNAPDLNNQQMLQNIYSGKTALDPRSNTGSYSPETFAKSLFHKPDESKWYNAERLIPLATIAGMSLIGGGIASGLAAPLAAGASGAVGGTAGGAVGGAITGGAAGLGGAAPSAYFQGVQGDVGGALKTLGTGAVGGAVTGGLVGGVSSGLGGGAQSGNLSPSEMEQLVGETARKTGMSPNQVMQMVQNLPAAEQDAVLQQLLTEAVPAAGGAADIFGRSPATDYGYDTSTEFDRISDINDPSNQSQYIKDLYGTGNTETLSALGSITDSGAALGIEPSNLALPESGSPINSIDKKNLLSRALELIGGGGEAPPASPTGFTNDMFTPLASPEAIGGVAPSLSSAQSGALGLQEGSTTPEYFTQQYEAVRPVQESYAQTLLSMAQQDPTILENPQVLNMIKSELESGGGPEVQYGLKRPLSLEGLV